MSVVIGEKTKVREIRFGRCGFCFALLGFGGDVSDLIFLANSLSITKLMQRYFHLEYVHFSPIHYSDRESERDLLLVAIFKSLHVNICVCFS